MHVKCTGITGIIFCNGRLSLRVAKFLRIQLFNCDNSIIANPQYYTCDSICLVDLCPLQQYVQLVEEAVYMYMEFDHSIYVEVEIENVLAVRLLSSTIVVKLSSCLRVQVEPSERNIQFHCCSFNFVHCVLSLTSHLISPVM